VLHTAVAARVKSVIKTQDPEGCGKERVEVVAMRRFQTESKRTTSDDIDESTTSTSYHFDRPFLLSRPPLYLSMMRSSFYLSVVMFRSFWNCTSSLPSFAAKKSNFKDAVKQASGWIKDAKSVLIVTGAGISAESGLPTYRGVSGLYNNDRATEDDGMTIEECLSGATYRTRPDLTWKYLMQIEQSCRGAEPSQAHRLVAKMENYIQPVTVMTQNVDGLHTRAGSTDVLCLHGELYKLRCTGECKSHFEVESYEPFEQKGIFPPPCEKCGGAVRPSVVLFDEYLGDDTVQTYEDRLGEPMSTLMWTMSPTFPRYDVSISIGTSALFQYVNAAALAGKRTIEINPGKTPLSGYVDVQIEAGATEALQAIFDELDWEA
jgi:NAD-dependent deacetylase